MSHVLSAQSRIDSFIRAESRLSSYDKPKQLENETKASYCWRLIRQSVRHAIDVVKKADYKDILIIHGVHHNRKLNHPHPVECMIVNKKTKEYVTYDGHMLRVFKQDGRKKDIITPPAPFKRLVYATHVNLCVGWSPGEDKVYLLTDQFEIQSTSVANGPIHAMIYNENIGEILTVGKGFLTNWVFRYGGRHVLPRRTCCEGFNEDDQFDLVALEETASHSQKLFCASGTDVAVFNVYDGRLLTRRKDLHVRPISALLHFNPLKYLITAARDGCIKVWDIKWHIQLVFVGHGDEVTSLAVYPYGPNIMSASKDCTLRVWSLETCDQVDQLTVEKPLTCVSTLQNEDNFFSFTDTYADLWVVKHVHTLHTRISYRVQQIKTTDHPEYPLRNLVLCRDSSIRIVSPTTGDVITTLIQPTHRTLVDAAYAVADSILYAVYGDGAIVKSATCTNPCTVLDEWPCPDPAKACNYLLVYEYVISSDLGGDTWGGMKRAIAVGGIGTPSSSQGKKPTSANRTLLLGGRKDGHICVFNRDTGEMTFEIEAHGTKGVLSMVANSKADQLISAGLDNIIKVWRLYPYALESLAPLMSFFCAHTPIYMSILKTRLAVAFQEPSTATFNVVMYDLRNKDSSYHGPEDDHLDNITGLTACNKMRLLATCSLDGTVKIWNEVNVLIRVIRLNAIPYSVAFCSEKGDLLLGIGEHVHKIDYKKYMPKDYRFKMVSMRFRPQEEEKALPFDENLLSAMSREDIKRLKAARSSFKFTHFVDILTDEENDEVLKVKKLREKAFAELEERDKLLNKIKDGKLLPSRKPQPTEMIEAEAFDKYLRIFYSRTSVNIPDDEFSIEDNIKKKIAGESVKPEPKYTPENEPAGFFPSPSSAKPATSTASPERSDIPVPTPASLIRADGFVPNSVLVRLLWPQEVMDQVAAKKKEEEQSTYRPPQMTLEQLKQISSLQQKKRSLWDEDAKSKMAALSGIKTKIGILKTFEGLSFKDRTLVLDYDDEETAKKSVVEEEGKSSFMEQMEDMMKTEPTPPLLSPEPEPKPETQPQPPPAVKQAARRVVSPPRTEAPQRKVLIKPKPPPARIPAPAPPLVVKRPPPAEVRSQLSEDRSSSPPSRQVTPLPEFITQFKGEDWFEKYFPKCSAHTMPKPWTSQAFAVMLARVLRIAEYREKVHITAAISSLHREKPLKDPESVTSVIYSIFDHNVNPPRCADPDQKAFLLKALELLHGLGVYDKRFYSHLLVQFLDGDKDVRNIVLNILNNVGLVDPHSQLSRELDGWDIWNLDESNHSEELGRMCDDFLEKWLSSFKIHVQDSIERLKKGQNVHGRASPTQLRGHPKGILKKASVTTLGDDEELRTTVTFGRPPDRSAVENATYIEALNYFCEMAMEKNLDRIRNGGSSQPASTEVEVKNTVLVFPKIPGRSSLVRLGETHTSKCRPHRETSLATNLHFPPIINRGRQPAPGELYGFPSCINLPMKSIIMDPFGQDQQEYIQQPIMLMLKTAQKYFVHARSYLDTTN